MGGHKTGELEQNWGMCPQPWPKTATGEGFEFPSGVWGIAPADTEFSAF